MANQFYTPYPQFFDNLGDVLAGGYIQFYLTGTTTPQDTYSNAALSTPNTNPVVLDQAGRPTVRIFLDPSVAYKVELYDANDQLIWTGDPVADPAANVSAAITVYNGNPNGNVAGNAGSVGGSGASAIWDISNNLLYICTTTGDAATAVWTQVGAQLAGAISFTSDITPASLNTDQNNYSPTSFAAAAIVRQNCSAAVNITGLDGGTDGRILVWENISTTAGGTQTFVNQSSSSDADNRFALDGNLVLAPGQTVMFRYDGTAQRWKVIGSQLFQPVDDPGGRLSLTTAVPVLTSDVLAATTVYYTPYRHSYVPLYNGYAWYRAKLSADLSQALSDTLKSPAAATANNLYDLFVWNDNGTLRCTRGPAWSSTTARGSGVGTTELERVDGRYVNRRAITNGPAAQLGLYVGTIATDSSNQLNMEMAPAAAAGGTANRLDVWNMYNRVEVNALMRMNDNSWTYTTATIRAADGSNSNRVTYVVGLAEDAVEAIAKAAAANSGANISVRTGVGIDVTSAFSGLPGAFATASGADICGGTGYYKGIPGLGQHFIQLCEYSTASGTTTWYGDGATGLQSGLNVSLPM
ncbi:MAG: hypothetical protein E6Q97_24785 [Desulfurellales bacterium]|nr:MAG: hypothetical protein E6Q97_24785 [Desulfurellales bacterium]